MKQDVLGYANYLKRRWRKMEFFFNWIGGSRKIGDQLISMNPNLGRIVLYQKTLDLIKEKTKQDLKFVRLGITDEHPYAFWIKPCSNDDEGALKVHVMGNTRMVSAKQLFNKLKEKGWYVSEGKTDQFPAEWDSSNEAVKIQLQKQPDPEA
jgi:hypothetical protein